MRPLVLTALLLQTIGSFERPANAQSTEVTRKPVQIEVAGNMTDALLAPNENHVIFVQRDGRDLEIMMANPDGTEPRKLTDNTELDYEPDWAPDSGRIVFCSARSGIHQLYSMDIDGGDVRRLTDHEFGCRLPRYNSRGDLAWLRMSESERGKAQPATLVVQMGETQKDLVESDLFSDHAWNPGGEWLAAGSVGRLHFVDPESDEQIALNLHEQDNRLHAHAPYDIQWSPVGDAVACRIRFVGGRMGDGTIFGDNEVFLISLVREFDYFDNIEDAREEHDWIH
ncbi:MAG: TolB family protein [Pirellulaceae bacterium]